ncbi:hypothetical protein QAD02_018870 [Eretmocerus hayati]|uniref:Uncharacterized protein n=1 Tax=Eretmocerus hayati TaxID=131215 RepID=A0ACC2PI02_9HYME|nr:hypothetical protein QAD02_018870 [Eretmocerus hayati]
MLNDDRLKIPLLMMTSLVPEFDGKNIPVYEYSKGLREVKQLVAEEDEPLLTRILQIKLRGLAHDLIAFDEIDNIHELMKRIRDWFRSSEDIYDLYAKLMHSYQQPNESVIDYTVRLKDLIDRIKDLNEFEQPQRCLTKEQFERQVDENGLKQFIRGLKLRIKIFMGQHISLDTAIAQAIQLECQVDRCPIPHPFDLPQSLSFASNIPRNETIHKFEFKEALNITYSSFDSHHTALSNLDCPDLRLTDHDQCIVETEEQITILEGQMLPGEIVIFDIAEPSSSMSNYLTLERSDYPSGITSSIEQQAFADNLIVSPSFENASSATETLHYASTKEISEINCVLCNEIATIPSVDPDHAQKCSSEDMAVCESDRIQSVPPVTSCNEITTRIIGKIPKIVQPISCTNSCTIIDILFPESEMLKNQSGKVLSKKERFYDITKISLLNGLSKIYFKLQKNTVEMPIKFQKSSILLEELIENIALSDKSRTMKFPKNLHSYKSFRFLNVDQSVSIMSKLWFIDKITWSKNYENEISCAIGYSSLLSHVARTWIEKHESIITYVSESLMGIFFMMITLFSTRNVYYTMTKNIHSNNSQFFYDLEEYSDYNIFCASL